jgi:hypothetical protein
MPRVLVNNSEQSVERTAATWGALLERLDAQAQARGEVVSAVRFDGVDEPTFAQQPHTARVLTEFGLIEVETATPRALVEAALHEAVHAADALAAAGRQTSSGFRGADPTAANPRLGEFAEGVRSLMLTLQATAAALGVTLSSLEWNGRPLPEQFGLLTVQLQAVIDAQSSRDWLTVADLLEYELQPLLDTARQVFESLRASAASVDERGRFE